MFRCKARHLFAPLFLFFLVSNHILDVPHLPIDDLMDDLNQDEDTVDPDDRRNRRLLDSRVQADGELSDSDDEGEGGRKNQHSHKDDDDLVPARKFVTTTGIMNPGASAASHGAGPSAHPPTSIPTALVTADEMDVDYGSTEEPPAEESKPGDPIEKGDPPKTVPPEGTEDPELTLVPPASDTAVQDKLIEDASKDAAPGAETAPPTIL